jgi:hypothetical protein
MDLNRFEQCCDAFGAERQRWPEHERALYDRFAGTPEGAAILAAASRVDRFLAGFEAASPQAHAAARIGALARPAWRRLARPAAALAASAVLGFAVGFAQAQSAAESDVSTDLLLGPRSLPEIGL